MRARYAIPSLFVVFVLKATVLAGPFEDGKKAFEEADYLTALLRLEPLAEKGNAQAQTMVGRMYFNGVGAHENPGAGVAWFRKAAAQGDIEAETHLGLASLKGRGTKLDYAEAMSWLSKAADADSQQAQIAIGSMYDQGLGVPKDSVEARKWFEKARRPPQLPKEMTTGLSTAASLTLYSLQPWGGPDIPQWDFHGHHVLGKRELTGNEAKRAIAALQAALSAGDTGVASLCLIHPRHALAFVNGSDTYAILICYQCGQLEAYKNDHAVPFEGILRGEPDVLNGLLQAKGIPLADQPEALQKSYGEEAAVARKLAEQGDANAQAVIARMLMTGRGGKEDEVQGIQWLARSMSLPANDPLFQVRLGKMYQHDNDLKSNPGKAMKLFQQAASQGNVEALYQLAEIYQIGEGTERNPAEALKLLRSAAEKGYPKAEFDLGVRYAQGDNVKLDYSEALRWVMKAADQAHPEALTWMGNMYEEGWGVAKDPSEAYFWARLATAYGSLYRSHLYSKPTPEQLATVDKRIAEWMAEHPKSEVAF